MKPSPPDSSSDLERTRASAERLTRPGADVPEPESLGYIRFSTGRSGARPVRQSTPAPAPVPSPPPEAVPPAPPALETEAAPAPEEISVETVSADDSEVSAAAEDMIQQLVTEAEEGEPPPWAEVLENCVAVSQARAALILDPRGRILAASEQLPKAKLDAIAGRLMQTLEGIEADPSLPEAQRAASVQLGAFWLTGLRVPVGPEHVSIGLLASAEVGAAALPAVEAEARRGAL